MRYTLPRSVAFVSVLLIAVLAITLGSGLAWSTTAAFPITNRFVVTPLASDIPGVARFTNPNLVNPWGMEFLDAGSAWVADNGTGLISLLTRTGIEQAVVNVPVPVGVPGPSAPTGLVINRGFGFEVSQRGVTAPARVIVATEEGTIAGWAPEVNVANAIIAVAGFYGVAQPPITDPVYKGLALARDSFGDEFLYATDFRHNQVNVFDSTFTFVGSFTDPDLPVGFAPFGIHNIGGLLWVTFALRDEDGTDDVPGPGNGFVDIFDVDGTLIRHFAADGPLNSPWGITVPPAGFTSGNANDPDDNPNTSLLIGNFGDGRINVFDLRFGGQFQGQLAQQDGFTPLVIDGLWSIETGFRGPLFWGPNTPTVFFTAGINDEANGLFGKITPVVRSPFTFPTPFSFFNGSPDPAAVRRR